MEIVVACIVIQFLLIGILHYRIGELERVTKDANPRDESHWR